MNAIELLPFILFIVVIATAIAERINIPYPLLLVVAGIGIGFIPHMPNWVPPSNIVLALFLPPILFSAARNISWRETRNNLGTVFSLSVVLVIITTFALGGILHAVYPAFGFESALVLGAIVSPTDAVAATSILSKMNVKTSLIRSLDVESLFNDATGISLYNMAVFFVFVDKINFSATTKMLVFSGIGGILIGLLLSYFTHLIVEQFLGKSENDLPIIMSLILAYVAYLFSEQLGASGILAVVAAGLYHKRTERVINARIRLTENVVWRTLVFFLNGLIFITIGNQFPAYIEKIAYIPLRRLIALAAVTIFGVLFFRFAWVAIFAYGKRLLQNLKKSRTNVDDASTSWTYILITSWGGMRGMVSMALAIGLPVSLSSAVPFPRLNLIIFLTVIVILFTLLIQGLTLPLLVKWLKASRDSKAELKLIENIYQRLTKRTISKLKEMPVFTNKKFSTAAKKMVENYYANRLLHFTTRVTSDEDTAKIIREAKILLCNILEQERRQLIGLRENGDISEEVYLKIRRKLDRDEVGFASYH